MRARAERTRRGERKAKSLREILRASFTRTREREAPKRETLWASFARTRKEKAPKRENRARAQI